jgi:hypothetical protein
LKKNVERLHAWRRKPAGVLLGEIVGVVGQ